MGLGRAVARGDAGYPARFAELARPPDVVYLEGSWEHAGPVVALVGSRAATGDGTDVAYELAADLARSGVAVISGLARGIDAASHRGALDAGGKSGAVLGTSLSRVYPPEHHDLQKMLAESLGILSELAPGASSTRATFASRNRLLAALADAVVVVQGRAESGTRRTVEMARTLGRPIGAVPWDPREPLGEAPLALLREGASLIRHAGDVVSLLEGGNAAARSAAALPPVLVAHRGSHAASDSNLSGPERRLLDALRRHAEPLEAAAARARLTIAEAGAAIVVLELTGRAERAAGGAVRRARGG